MIAGIEEMENLDSSEIHPRSVNATEGRDTFRFEAADGTAKLFGRDHGAREPTLRREQLVRSKDLKEENFKASRKGLNRQKQKMTLKPGKTSGQSKVTSFIVITLNLEFNSTCRKKKHFHFY